MRRAWSAFWPAALAEAHRKPVAGREGAAARGHRFALVYFWATFIFFTLSGSRRSYYLLPILPAAAILVARTLAYPGELRSTFARRLLIVGYAIVAIAAVGGIVLLIPAWAGLPSPYDALPDLPAKSAFIVFWIVSVGP